MKNDEMWWKMIKKKKDKMWWKMITCDEKGWKCDEKWISVMKNDKIWWKRINYD